MQSLVTASDPVYPAWEPTGSGLIGRILGGRYRVLARLGSGGMGDVYVAEHQLLGCEVALKTLGVGLRNQPAAQRRFRQEAELGAALCHPNLVRVFDFETAGSDPYLVMELLKGHDLRRLLNDSRTLEVGRAVRLLRDALAGLSAAHAAGIVHRDVKPANLFVVTPSLGESCSVLDFGVARVTNRMPTALDTLTMSDRPLGTLAYMAPEQIQGASDVDARADVYSVAAILFEVLSGRRPFPAETAPEQIFRVLNERPPRLDHLDASVPPELADVIARGLSRDRAERFADAAAFSAALERFSRKTNVTLSDSMPRRRRPRFPVELLVSLGFGALLGYAFGPARGDSAQPGPANDSGVPKGALQGRAGPAVEGRTILREAPSCQPPSAAASTPVSTSVSVERPRAKTRLPRAAASPTPSTPADSSTPSPIETPIVVERSNPYQR